MTLHIPIGWRLPLIGQVANKGEFIFLVPNSITIIIIIIFSEVKWLNLQYAVKQRKNTEQ